jgi:hypothetical protein
MLEVEEIKETDFRIRKIQTSCLIQQDPVTWNA